jgi:outer membrane protein assembly factor BamB/orotate phosphoribosyltransferase
MTIGSKESHYSEIFDIRRLLISAEVELINHVVEILWQKIKPYGPQVIVSRGVGGITLLPLIQQHAWLKDCVKLSTLYVRKSRKTYGLKHIVEGPLPEEITQYRAAFLDDVFGKCNNFTHAKKTLLLEGYILEWVTAACVFDIWQIPGTRSLVAQGTPVHSVLTRPQLNLSREDKHLPQLVNHIKWHMPEFHTGVDYMESKGAPLIHDSKLFVCNDNTSISCMDLHSGSVLWTHVSRSPKIKGSVGIPVVYNSCVLWTSYDGCVRCHCIHTGHLNWIIHLDTAIHGTICVDHANHRAWIGTEWFKHGWDKGGYGLGDIVCFDLRTGNIIWRTNTGGMIPCSPVYHSGLNIVVIGSNDFHVRALDAVSGKVIWKVPTYGEAKGVIRVSPDGDYIMFQTLKSWVYCVHAQTGQIIWKTNQGGKSLHAWPLLQEDNVFITNDASHVIKLNASTGTRSAIVRLRSNVNWGVTPWRNNIIAHTEDGSLTLLDRYNLHKIASYKFPTQPKFIQPPAIVDDVAVMVSNNQGIFCVVLNEY